MKIIKRIADNVVLFAGSDLTLNDSGVHGPGWSFEKINPAILSIENVDSVPEYFIGGGWTYNNGEWASNSTGNNYMLPQKKAVKIAELEAARLALEYSNITHDGKIWEASRDRRALLAQVLSVNSVPESMYWRDAAGTEHAMTFTQLEALGRAILDRGLTADANLKTKRAAVEAAGTVEEVDAVVW